MRYHPSSSRVGSLYNFHGRTRACVEQLPVLRLRNRISPLTCLPPDTAPVSLDQVPSFDLLDSIGVPSPDLALLVIIEQIN